MPNWGFIIVFWVIFLIFAYLGVLAFGEVEFFVNAVKLLFIFAFFICAILLTSGAIGNQGAPGFSYYRDPGAFADGPAGVFKVFVLAGQVSSSSSYSSFSSTRWRNRSSDKILECETYKRVGGGADWHFSSMLAPK